MVCQRVVYQIDNDISARNTYDSRMTDTMFTADAREGLVVCCTYSFKGMGEESWGSSYIHQLAQGCSSDLTVVKHILYQVLENMPLGAIFRVCTGKVIEFSYLEAVLHRVTCTSAVPYIAKPM